MGRTTQFRCVFCVITASIFAMVLVSCQNSGGRSGMSDENGPSNPKPFGDDFMPKVDESLNSNGTREGGSETSGALSDADKQAIKNVLGEMEKTNPQGDDAGLSAALQAEAKKLMEDERRGRDIAAQKMLLAGKILEECAKKIAPLAPRPGQPLLGKWNGGGACAVSFEISGDGSQNAVYKVSGGTNGKMQADKAGNGAIQAEPFSGNVTDQPQAGSGKLTHPTFHQSKSGTSPCDVAVNLTDPTSPIPENYAEAMRQAGQCYRQALVLMSPVMDRLFDNMDPSLRSLIMSRALGIGK